MSGHSNVRGKRTVNHGAMRFLRGSVAVGTGTACAFVTGFALELFETKLYVWTEWFNRSSDQEPGLRELAWKLAIGLLASAAGSVLVVFVLKRATLLEIVLPGLLIVAMLARHLATPSNRRVEIALDIGCLFGGLMVVGWVRRRRRRALVPASSSASG